MAYALLLPKCGAIRTHILKVLTAVSQVWGSLVVKKKKKPIKTMLVLVTLFGASESSSTNGEHRSGAVQVRIPQKLLLVEQEAEATFYLST